MNLHCQVIQSMYNENNDPHKNSQGYAYNKK